MVSPVMYLREVSTELKKVSWPTLEHTRNMTILVIIVSILVGVYIGALDFVFQKLITALISI
jgi:preprotein translocase subunit SecE